MIRPLASFCCGLAAIAGAAEPPAFIADGNAFRFDTGALRGTLRANGRSLGLLPVTDCATGTNLARSVGLFSHYRLLDDTTRYGVAGWEWASTAERLPDGAVAVRWAADAVHPFDMAATYRWAATNALDVTTTVTPRKELKRFEVFLASYLEGFAAAFAYTKNGFLEAKKTDGVWQAFPRDADAEKLIADGRWKHPPNPVDWVIRPALAAPLGMRRDAASGLVALVMAAPQDCFAVSMPYSEEGHRSLYLSLFGRDLTVGTPATARARLVIGRGITEAQAIQVYEAFLKEKQP
jgi:hypothetical protein